MKRALRYSLKLLAIITNAVGDEIDVDVEWVDYGKLKATDPDGNEYELTVD